MDKIKIEKAYNAGWRDAVRLYAVWRNGEQVVGTRERPLREVLEDGPPDDDKNFSLRRLEASGC